MQIRSMWPSLASASSKAGFRIPDFFKVPPFGCN